MTTFTPSSNELTAAMEGVQYHAKTKALHIRLEKNELLLGIVALLEQEQSTTLFSDCESLHISLGESLLTDAQTSVGTNNNCIRLCEILGNCLHQLKEIHVGRAICGFLYSSTGALCPINALQVLLEKSTKTLEILMLRDLIFYTSAIHYQLEQQQEEPLEELASIDILSKCLAGNPSLLRFGLQHCEFAPPSGATTSATTLDPLLQALSTMPKLREIVVQSNHPGVDSSIPTNPNGLNKLVGSTIQRLHLDGLHLENAHIENLLLSSQQSLDSPNSKPTHYCSSLQNLSLSLDVTLDTIHDLACTIGKVLQSVPLRQVTLRLKWKVDPDAANATDANDINSKRNKRLRKQKTQALQSFQDTLAGALMNGYNNATQQKQAVDSTTTVPSPLQRLDIIYYDSSHRWDMTPPVLCTRSFQRVLEEHNFQLTHLRLPYCGEMNPVIDFFLKLNRTGLRQKVLASVVAKGKDTDISYATKNSCCERRLMIQGLLQIQQDEQQASKCNSHWSKHPNKALRNATTMPLSMMYYLLREMPGVFLPKDPSNSSCDDGAATTNDKQLADATAESDLKRSKRTTKTHQIPASLFLCLAFQVLIMMTSVVEGFMAPSSTLASKTKKLPTSNNGVPFFAPQKSAALAASTTHLRASSTTYATKGGTNSMPRSGGSYIRWKQEQLLSPNNADVWSLQTAVTTFQRTNPETKKLESIELHAQVHLGDKEYFDYYNSAEFNNRHDEVLYELLVDQDLLGLSKDKSGRVLTTKLQSSPNDQSVASSYGWQPQVDVIDYTQDKWKHADFTSQEMLQQQQSKQPIDDGRPLWQQIGNKSGVAFWQPAVSALFVGPPSLFVATDADDFFSDSPSIAKRKLFTNLFLPGNQFAGWLRAMLWVTVPAPEISVLLLDWSSLFLSRSSAKFSPVTLPILQSLMTLQVAQLRRLVFGQVLVAGNSAQQSQPQRQQQSQDWKLLITQRNEHALQVLKSSLRKKDANRIALLYGCSHCPDLHAKIVRDFGFTATKTEWRYAWSVEVPKTFAQNGAVSGGGAADDLTTAATSSRGGSTTEEWSIWKELYSYLPPTAWAALVVLFPLYLGIGAIDWVDTIHSSAVSLLDEHDSLAFSGEWVLYLLRHVLLYVAVSKFALEWQDPNSSNSNDSNGG